MIKGIPVKSVQCFKNQEYQEINPQKKVKKKLWMTIPLDLNNQEICYQKGLLSILPQATVWNCVWLVRHANIWRSWKKLALFSSKHDLTGFSHQPRTHLSYGVVWMSWHPLPALLDQSGWAALWIVWIDLVQSVPALLCHVYLGKIWKHKLNCSKINWNKNVGKFNAKNDSTNY